MLLDLFLGIRNSCFSIASLCPYLSLTETEFRETHLRNLYVCLKNTNIKDRGMRLEVRDRNSSHRTFQPGCALYQPTTWKTWSIPGCGFRVLCAAGSLVVNRKLIPSE